MRSLFLAWIFALCSTGPASAQAVTWTIDPGHSAAQFTVRHMLVANVRGEFDGPTGTVTFDPADFKTLKVDVSFDDEERQHAQPGSRQGSPKRLVLRRRQVSEDDVQVEARRSRRGRAG